MNRKRLLEEIKPEMKLTKQFFKRIYSLEIEYPGLADKALKKLEAAGCSKAKEYYNSYVKEYEEWYKVQCEPAAKWLIEQMEKQHREVNGKDDHRKENGYQFEGFPQNW